jgi:hypothetical protein
MVEVQSDGILTRASYTTGCTDVEHAFKCARFVLSQGLLTYCKVRDAVSVNYVMNLVGIF